MFMSLDKARSRGEVSPLKSRFGNCPRFSPRALPVLIVFEEGGS